jgi:hypothetical protein
LSNSMRVNRSSGRLPSTTSHRLCVDVRVVVTLDEIVALSVTVVVHNAVRLRDCVVLKVPDALGEWEVLHVCVVVRDAVDEMDMVRVGGRCRVGVPEIERVGECVALRSIDKLPEIDSESKMVSVVEGVPELLWLLLELADAVNAVDSDVVNEATSLPLLVVDVEFDSSWELDVESVYAVPAAVIERF